MRDYVRRLLSSRFEVVTAENGRDVLQKAIRQAPDLVLSDVMMPEMDGFQLLAALRQEKTTSLIPVILLSACAGEDAQIEGMESGADDYLVKPFTARELLARVEAHIKISRFRRQALEREANLQRELQDARQNAALALDHISDIFITFDSKWRYTFINTAGLKLLGLEPGELSGQTIWAGSRHCWEWSWKRKAAAAWIARPRRTEHQSAITRRLRVRVFRARWRRGGVSQRITDAEERNKSCA